MLRSAGRAGGLAGVDCVVVDGAAPRLRRAAARERLRPRASSSRRGRSAVRVHAEGDEYARIVDRLAPGRPGRAIIGAAALGVGGGERRLPDAA